MAAATLPANATQAQALAYLNATYGSYKYSNTAKTPYQGMTAAQIYAYIAKQNPKATPYNVAVASADVILSSGVGATVGAAANTAGTALGGVATGVETASLLPSWADGLTNLLGALANKNTWIRVAKVIVGGVLLIVGLVHITGADNAVATAARKVPLPV